MQSILASMNIEKVVITAYARFFQTETRQLILVGKGDYLLQVKNNQGMLLKDIEAYFYITERDFPAVLIDGFFICWLVNTAGLTSDNTVYYRLRTV